MGKTIGIVLALVLVLGVVGFIAVKTGWFATAKEAGEEWMDEQQLKNFPALARQELKGMESKLEETRVARKKLNTKINMLRGTDNMPEETLIDESNGYATIKGYEILVTRKSDYVSAREKAIKSIVAEVKKGQDDYIKAGGAVSESGAIPENVKYTVTRPNGTTTQYTMAEARKVTDDLAKEIGTAKKELERYKKRQDKLTSIVKNMESTGAKLDKAIETQAEKINDMKIFIQDMEAELKLLEIEKDIAAINAAIEGKESDSDFGKLIGKFKKAQKEFYAGQADTESAAKEAEKGPSASDFMGADSGSSNGGAADDYWK